MGPTTRITEFYSFHRIAAFSVRVRAEEGRLTPRVALNLLSASIDRCRYADFLASLPDRREAHRKENEMIDKINSWAKSEDYWP